MTSNRFGFVFKTDIANLVVYIGFVEVTGSCQCFK